MLQFGVRRASGRARRGVRCCRATAPGLAACGVHEARAVPRQGHLRYVACRHSIGHSVLCLAKPILGAAPARCRVAHHLREAGVRPGAHARDAKPSARRAMMGPRRLPGSSPGRAVVDAPSALRRARVGWRRPLAAILVIGLACVTASCLASRPVVLAVLRVSPPAAAVMVGDSVQLSARVEDGGGNQLSMPPVTWWSNDTSVATVTAGGLVTAVGPGTATITATSAGDSAGAEIRVSAHRPGTVSDLVAGPVTDSSLTLAFTEVTDGTGRAASYDIRYAAGPFSWGSAKSVTSGTCATPLAGTRVGSQPACSVLGLAAGTTYSFELVAFRGRLNGKVEFGELSNTATGTTAPSTAPVASVSITPRNAWVLVGGTLQLAVTLKDAKGNTLTGRTVNWTSSDSAVAKASTTGRVTGVELGSATITAESEGLSDSALVTVVAAPPPVTYDRTHFTDRTTGPLDVYAYGNGSCAESTEYEGSRRTYYIKCT